MLHPQHVVRVINEKAADDAIFTPDVGLPIVWAARYLTMNGKRRLIGSYWHGSMANAMPQAIGAQAASPGRQVISLSGDGGFTMLMGDLLSLTQLKLPVKVFVFNNGYSDSSHSSRNRPASFRSEPISSIQISQRRPKRSDPGNPHRGP